MHGRRCAGSAEALQTRGWPCLSVLPRRLLPYLQDKGVGIINASVLSMGLLTHQARRSACSSLCLHTADRRSACIDIQSCDRGLSFPECFL